MFIGVLYLLICRTTEFRVPCLFHELTGLDCPGCGTTRMVIHLSELDFASALYDNPLVFTTSPVIMYLVGCMTYRYIGYEVPDRMERMNQVIAAILTVMFVIFGAYRILTVS